MATIRPKMHHRVGGTFGGQPLARCGLRIVDGNITTATAPVTCGNCKRGMQKDRELERGGKRHAVGS